MRHPCLPIKAQRHADARTRAAVPALQWGDPGRLRFPQPGGSRQVSPGPRRRQAVGASGLRLIRRRLVRRSHIPCERS